MDAEILRTVINTDLNVKKIGDHLIAVKYDVDTIDASVKQLIKNQDVLLANQKLILDLLREK